VFAVFTTIPCYDLRVGLYSLELESREGYRMLDVYALF
jgi:hypothetical protein